MCPVSGYFDQVFANAGSKVAVPDTVQVDGSVSYPAGYGVYYTQDPAVNPSTALNVEETKFNQLLYDITSVLQNYQQNCIPPFITSTMNGGSPYSYPKGPLVMSGGIPYQSIAASNTDTPPSSKWVVFDLSTLGAGFLLAANNLSDVANGSSARANLNAASSGANSDITSLNSPALGSATANTQAVGTSNTEVATTRFSNPATAASPNGYVQTAGGIYIQWGTGTASSGGSNATFPITFPTGCQSIMCTINGSSPAGNGAVSAQIINNSTGKFWCASSSTGIFYTAIGY